MSHPATLPPGLSVIMPAFNEEATVQQALRQVAQHPKTRQIVLVDDGSTDKTLQLVRNLQDELTNLHIIALPQNAGKGAAVRTGLAAASEDVFVIQDCDLEYRLDQWEPMLAALEQGADFVIGNRFGNGLIDFRFPLHAVFNITFSFLLAKWWNLPIHDVECCTKMGRTADFAEPWHEDRFGIEVELVAAVARKQMRVQEFRVPYHPRGYRQGKKIGWRDAIEALQCAWKYRP